MNYERELHLIAALFEDPRQISRVAEVVHPGHFFDKDAGQAYRAMLEMTAEGIGVDVPLVTERLIRNGLSEHSARQVTQRCCEAFNADPANIQTYAKEVREEAAKHTQIKLAEKAVKVVADNPRVSAAVLGEIGNAMSQAAVGETDSPKFSEDALALRFSRKYTNDLRYVAKWGQWMRWDGCCWREDQTLHVFDLARGICRATALECSESEKATAARLTSKSTSAAVERMAAADRRHAATTGQWDADIWLLNTPAGTVDLHTGQLRDHRREDFITKITTANPGEGCPLWMQFLVRVTASNRELQGFLQRMVGYSLTGSTREHALFFLYGTGANGKSVFLSIVSQLLGAYAKTAPASSFTATTSEHHPTDLAGLRGARFVSAIETEDGTRWAEAKIKNLTGGDTICARFMRQDFFEYTPEFKLVIAGNHKPGLRSVDEAIRRRLHLVPFTVTIPEQERDPNLTDKLRTEFPGILTWAIQGCLQWQRDGLNPPAVVRDATADYLASEDAVGRWLEDRCITDRKCWSSASALFSNWQTWCEQTGERETSMKRFVQQLEARGFQRERSNRAKGFLGIGLKEDVVPHVPGSPILGVHAHARA